MHVHQERECVCWLVCMKEKESEIGRVRENTKEGERDGEKLKE